MVRCSCGTDNLEKKFCTNCGKQLIYDCEKCKKPIVIMEKFCGTCGLRTLIMMLVQNPQYEQILSPCVIAAQAVFLGSLVIAFLDKALDFLAVNPMTSLSARGVLKTCFP